MEIKRILPSADQQAAERAPETDDKALEHSRSESARKASSAHMPDRLLVSRDYRQISPLRRAAVELSDIRSEYVDSIGKMVENGAYLVRPHEIVKKMIEEAI